MTRLIKTLLLLTAEALWRLSQQLTFWCKKHPSQAFTTALVIAAHITFIATIVNNKTEATVMKPRGRVVVNTVKLRPPPPPPKQKKTAPKKAVAKAKTPKKKTLPTPKKDDKADQKLQEKQNRLKEALNEALNKAMTNLDNLDTIPEKPTKPLPSIGLLDIDTSTKGVDPKDLGYCEELIQRLRLMLRLPDYGEVQVKLTLDRNGTVANLEIVNSKNNTNKTYIEKNLATLTFPPFGNNFTGERHHTFFLALSNDA